MLDRTPAPNHLVADVRLVGRKRVEIGPHWFDSFGDSHLLTKCRKTCSIFILDERFRGRICRGNSGHFCALAGKLKKPSYNQSNGISPVPSRDLVLSLQWTSLMFYLVFLPKMVILDMKDRIRVGFQKSSSSERSDQPHSSRLNGKVERSHRTD